MKVRQNLYIDRELSDALGALVIRRGSNKSRIVNEALKSWLARRASKEVDDLLKVRLDRISREIGACRRDIEVVLEALSLFVRYQLTVTAPLPEADAAALATGNARFERFIAQLGRQIATGKRTLDTADAA
ncbi:CopG family transcriptional regulator [Sphingosinicella microcystinivorans]|uniref:CopG family transcriptional regulator n=1 Tax=Sphingosinicella microcystinivorans TaxID=335406 RepID=UPI0022F39454|nr:CopG family transcriptional regulator [Sphingosinicella microcystinivorans]WBX82853.1 CopG family transcriptional regulator [Sphingosinicella microcystinivorans]